MLFQPDGVKPPAADEVRNILTRAQSLTDDDQAELGRVIFIHIRTGEPGSARCSPLDGVISTRT
jgi:hypothetical protein